MREGRVEYSSLALLTEALFLFLRPFLYFIVPSSPDHPDHMYYFEGKDYSKIPSVEDEKRFKLMVQEHSAPQEHAGKAGRSLRHKVGVSPFSSLRNLVHYIGSLLYPK